MEAEEAWTQIGETVSKLQNEDNDATAIERIETTVVANARFYWQTHGVLTISVVTVMKMLKGLQQVQRPQKLTDLLTCLAVEDGS